ncbi:MAG TPA: prepilin-type N-terminal cleavage/methylation domain-containing protein [Bryobacteraceae bacterium]|nr:prepilin-type N-terminal cleavage/methylation domain-containing protein [Bryobacteraceae bacterium]
MRRGFSLIELLIVIAIILIIITVSVPAYNKAQMFAREMAASKAVQTIQTAEVMYQSQNGHYAQTLRELGPPETGPSTAAAAGLISGSLAGGTVGGYKFTLHATTDTYAIGASPVAYGASGRKSFYMDQTGILRANDEPEPATSASPEFAK